MKASASAKGAAGFALILIIIAVMGSFIAASIQTAPAKELPTFNSCSELASAFDKARQQGYGVWGARGSIATGIPMMAAAETGGSGGSDDAKSGAPSAAPQANGDFSTTNVQVAGVDEADIVKTDGTYIYTLSTTERYYDLYFEEGSGTGSLLVIAKAYPADDAEILSETGLGEFYPSEMFINGDRLLLFGATYEEIPVPEPRPMPAGGAAADIAASYPYPYTVPITTVQVWDISYRSEPELVRTIDFEGSYLTSRKIGSDVYFVMNSYPRVYAMPLEGNITADAAESMIPVYRDSSAATPAGEAEFTPACGCVDVSYFEPVQAQRFVTIASISMSDDDAEVTKEVVVGSGENVYSSMQNLYVAESVWPSFWRIMPLGEASDGGETTPTERTVVHKFGLDSGSLSYQGNAEVPGHIINQFSMDEHNGYFRIATTIGRVSRTGEAASANNIYVLDSDLEQSGKIEDIAPGEQIYSARFMGDRGYLVTFKKIDPFFVIDLADPANPRILGKLKIPGYSDYLHPYDENHIIGIGKETVETEDDGPWGGNFAWYQGVKIAVFDVTDVSNPVELHRTIIGDRGTDSEALRDHKAFLFDRGRNLLVLPITLAEIAGDKETLPDNTYGDFVYQGAYVYDLTLENGFDLKGRITHYDSDESFKKAGYYWGGHGLNVRRSLYIGDVLYTISNGMIKANSLSDLSEIKELAIAG